MQNWDMTNEIDREDFDLDDFAQDFLAQEDSVLPKFDTASELEELNLGDWGTGTKDTRKARKSTVGPLQLETLRELEARKRAFVVPPELAKLGYQVLELIRRNSKTSIIYKFGVKAAVLDSTGAIDPTAIPFWFCMYSCCNERRQL